MRCSGKRCNAWQRRNANHCTSMQSNVRQSKAIQMHTSQGKHDARQCRSMPTGCRTIRANDVNNQDIDMQSKATQWSAMQCKSMPSNTMRNTANQCKAVQGKAMQGHPRAIWGTWGAGGTPGALRGALRERSRISRSLRRHVTDSFALNK